jgi:hypothetical protein
MRRSNLILLLVGTVDAILIGIAGYLIIGIRDGSIHTGIESSAAVERIVRTMGGAVGVFTALGLLAFLVMRSQKN